MDFSNPKNTATNSNNEHLLFNLAPIMGKKVELSFTSPDISSDGGLLLLKECESRIGIIKSITSCLTDARNPAYIRHTYEEMITQRVFQIAAGYEDADDCDSLKSDNILKICTGRLPSDLDLASQPTMSRFENAVTKRELLRASLAIVDGFIKSYAAEPTIIILDADDTNSDAYGGQQGCLFNDYYNEYCFMPLHIYEGLSGKLITTVLKPGRRSKNVDVFIIMAHLIKRLRRCWKKVKIVVRGDSHFCSHQLMDWCQGIDNVSFITGLAGNSVLKGLSASAVKTAKNQFKQTKQPVKLYHSFEYKAGSWQNAQRVIVKVEVSDRGENIRYIVTDMREWRTRQLYELGYCARGAMELRIKEHKTYLKSDRMSCSQFNANQFRLFMHSAAYVLIHTLQTETLKGTQFATATFKTIREKIIKVAAYVKEMKTKIQIQLPASCPQIAAFSQCLLLFEFLRT